MNPHPIVPSALCPLPPAFFNLIGALAGALIGTLIGIIIGEPISKSGLIGGFTGVLVGGFAPGGACIQHFTLRLILYFNGYIPWNYAQFLDYCTERMLLQRVGGRYRFIHKVLQDHFAQMEFEIKHPK